MKSIQFSVVLIAACLVPPVVGSTQAAPKPRASRPQTVQQNVPMDNRSLYDPSAGRHTQRKGPDITEQVRTDVNPCNRDYGFVLNGWHNVVVQYAIENSIWWTAILLSILLAAVAFDDYFRKCRSDDMREAFISASLMLINERAMYHSRANEAIARHNQMVALNDALQSQIEANTQASTQQTAQAGVAKLAAGDSMTLTSVASMAPNSSTSSQSKEPYTAGNAGPVIETTGIVEPTEAPAAPVQPMAEGETEFVNLGGQQVSVAPEVARHIRELGRKIGNLRTQVNIKDEKLRKYGE